MTTTGYPSRVLIATHNTDMIKITESEMESHPIESGTEVKAPNIKRKGACIVKLFS